MGIGHGLAGREWPIQDWGQHGGSGQDNAIVDCHPQQQQQLNQLTPPLQQQYQQQYRPRGESILLPHGEYNCNTNSNYDYFNNDNQLTATAAEANDNNDDKYLNNILQSTP